MKGFKFDIPSIHLDNNVEENILNTASHLFFNYGIRGVSIDDITATIGISKKTFYKNFHDKEMLLQIICKRKTSELISELHKSSNIKSAKNEASHIFDVIINFTSSFSHHFFRDLEIKFPMQYQHFVSLKKEIVENILSRNIINGILVGEYKNDIMTQTIASLWFDIIIICQKEGYNTSQVKQHFIDGLLNK